MPVRRITWLPGRPLEFLVALAVLTLVAAACGSEAGESGDTERAGSVTVTTVSVGSSSSGVDTSSTTAATETTTGATSTTEGTPGDGRELWCFSSDDGVTTMNLRLRLVGTDLVGQRAISIANDEAGYYTSALEELAGTQRADGSWAVDITTWIEYDVQTSSEVWSITVGGAETPSMLIPPAACGVVDPFFEGVVGLGDDGLDGLTVRVDERISFDPGGISGTVSGAVVGGERDVYRIEASGGQEMQIDVTSVEDNAVYDVIGPAGLILATEARGGSIFLPHTGDYILIVGSDRGNATYEITVTIP